MKCDLVRIQLYRAAVLLVALSVASCSSKPEVTAIGSTLSVVEPDRRFASSIANGQLPDEWEKEGQLHRNGLSIGGIDGQNALLISPGAKKFAVYRRVHARLLAMPFLAWSWRAVLPRSGPHPVRLIVGLYSPQENASPSFFGSFRGRSVNRVIEIEWSGSALRRGALVGPYQVGADSEGGLYTARGGPEQGMQWQNDTADIATIFDTLWPDSIHSETEVRFVGIRSLSGARGDAMAVANIRLMR